MGFLSLFGKSKNSEEESLPKNEVEQWVTSTYALWSEYCGGSRKYIGGYRKNRANASMMRGVLRRDWLISDHDEGVEMVDYLLNEKSHTGEAEQTAAWDYCRTCQLAGMFYVAGYMERQEMMELSVKAARIMQQNYRSWDELILSYIKGYTRWRKEEGGNAEEEIRERNELYQKLKSIPDGPYSLPWKLLII